MMLLALLAGCVLLMEKPPACPESCPGNFACDETFGCRTTCAYEGDDCAEGYYCTRENTQAGECRDACQEGDCPGNFACWGNDDCYDFCSEDSECADGYVCCNAYDEGCPESKWHTCVLSD